MADEIHLLSPSDIASPNVPWPVAQQTGSLCYFFLHQSAWHRLIPSSFQILTLLGSNTVRVELINVELLTFVYFISDWISALKSLSVFAMYDPLMKLHFASCPVDTAEFERKSCQREENLLLLKNWFPLVVLGKIKNLDFAFTDRNGNLTEFLNPSPHYSNWKKKKVWL